MFWWIGENRMRKFREIMDFNDKFNWHDETEERAKKVSSLSRPTLETSLEYTEFTSESLSDDWNSNSSWETDSNEFWTSSQKLKQYDI